MADPTTTNGTGGTEEPPPTISKVIVGVDETPTARRAAEAAAALARATGATLYVATALPSSSSVAVRGPGGDAWHDDALVAARDRLLDLVASWPELKTDVLAEVGKPADVLVRAAQRLEVDVIVVGNRRMQGVSRVLGAVANDVAHHAPCDVYIVNTVDAS